MSDTHSADQSGDGCGVKDISDHPVSLALVESPLRTAGDDAACVLAAMLEEGEAFADLLSCVEGGIVVEEA